MSEGKRDKSNFYLSCVYEKLFTNLPWDIHQTMRSKFCSLVNFDESTRRLLGVLRYLSSSWESEDEQSVPRAERWGKEDQCWRKHICIYECRSTVFYDVTTFQSTLNRQFLTVTTSLYRIFYNRYKLSLNITILFDFFPKINRYRARHLSKNRLIGDNV